MRHCVMIRELVDQQVGNAGKGRSAGGEFVHHQAARHDVRCLLRFRDPGTYGQNIHAACL
jgi:hypothetical protein